MCIKIITLTILISHKNVGFRESREAIETSVQTGFCYFVHKKMSEIRVLHSTLDRMINLFSRYGPKKLETAVGRAPLCFCHLHMIWTGLLSMSFVKMVTMCGR